MGVAFHAPLAIRTLVRNSVRSESPGFQDLKSGRSGTEGPRFKRDLGRPGARSQNDTLSRPVCDVLAADPSMLAAASSLPHSVLLNQMVILTSNQTSNLPPCQEGVGVLVLDAQVLLHHRGMDRREAGERGGERSEVVSICLTSP